MENVKSIDEDWVTTRYGASSSGCSFSTIHWDLVFNISIKK